MLYCNRRVMSTTELINFSSELICSMELITLRLKIPSNAVQAVGFTVIFLDYLSQGNYLISYSILSSKCYGNQVLRRLTQVY